MSPKDNRLSISAQVYQHVISENASSEPEPADLRKVRDSIPRRLWVVAIISFWERAAFWGLTAPWRAHQPCPPLPLSFGVGLCRAPIDKNYMENPAHGEKPGALGLGQAMATRIYCCFYIFYYVAPILVAVIADNWLSLYNTLVVSFVAYCLGIAVLTFSSVPAYLDKGWGIPGLVVAMVLVGAGGAGVKSVMPPFIADQYLTTKCRKITLKSGEQVITDRELTLQYIYNLYFWVGNVGALSCFATVFLEDHYGFTSAYGLTLGLLGIALMMLIAGKPWYIRTPRSDNVMLLQAMKIIYCAAKNGWKMDNATPQYQRERRQNTVAWTEQVVEELTRVLRTCRVLLAFVMFYICFDQMQNNLISQAGQMRTNGTPNDLLPAMNQVSCIILGPIIQMGLYPLLHRRRIYLKPILRISIGFFFMSLAMLYATAVQHVIYSSPPCYDFSEQCDRNSTTLVGNMQPPNVWFQAPVYLLIAVGEILAYTTALEYAYEYSPKDMKVIVQAINLLMGGVGSAVALALTAVAHDPNLVIFYASLSGAMAITTFVFWLVFRRYDKSHTVEAEHGLAQVTSITSEERSVP